MLSQTRLRKSVPGQWDYLATEVATHVSSTTEPDPESRQAISQLTEALIFSNVTFSGLQIVYLKQTTGTQICSSLDGNEGMVKLASCLGPDRFLLSDYLVMSEQHSSAPCPWSRSTRLLPAKFRFYKVRSIIIIFFLVSNGYFRMHSFFLIYFLPCCFLEKFL